MKWLTEFMQEWVRDDPYIVDFAFIGGLTFLLTFIALFFFGPQIGSLIRSVTQ